MGHICIKYENKLYPMTHTYQLCSVYPQQREVQPNHFLPGQQNNWFWTGHFYSQGLLSGGSKIWKPNRVAKNSQVLASHILILRYQIQHQQPVSGYFDRDINLSFTSCRSGVSLHTYLTKDGKGMKNQVLVGHRVFKKNQVRVDLGSGPWA